MKLSPKRLLFDVMQSLLVMGLILVIPLWDDHGIPYPWYYMIGLAIAYLLTTEVRALVPKARFVRNETEGFLSLWSVLTVLLYMIVYSTRGLVDIYITPMMMQILAVLFAIVFVSMGVYLIYVQRNVDDVQVRGALGLLYCIIVSLMVAGTMPALFTVMVVCAVILVVEMLVLLNTK